jgi:predicted dehydrogenase
MIVGTGSVGKRHARNFSTLGFKISGVDPRADRCAELAQEVAGATAYLNIEQAIAASRFDGAVVCSPPNAHVAQTRVCLEAGLPVLLEKPVSPDLAEARGLSEFQRMQSRPVLLGYTWRWWPPLIRMRELLRLASIGALRHVRFVMSANLADWHPWERYQDFFMARRDQGGGALLDESHWIDLACWLFGEPETVTAHVEKISDLEIDTDDNVDLQLRYTGNLRVTLHLDLFGRPHEKSITFVGEQGTLRWTADPNEIAIGRGISGWERLETFTCERNDMFLEIAKEFARVIDGATPSCTLNDGLRVLQIVQAARIGHAERRSVDLKELI